MGERREERRQENRGSAEAFGNLDYSQQTALRAEDHLNKQSKVFRSVCRQYDGPGRGGGGGGCVDKLWMLN